LDHLSRKGEEGKAAGIRMEITIRIKIKRGKRVKREKATQGAWPDKLNYSIGVF
jgi:hypothetical protein